jgi:CRISPR/Cas system CMR subunit Cmr4 (Cas7 group RAMP superfamily)
VLDVQRSDRVVPDQAARVFELHERLDLVGDAIAVAIDAAHDPAAILVLAERTLLVDADEHFAARGRGETRRVVHVRRLREDGHLKAGGRWSRP